MGVWTCAVQPLRRLFTSTDTDTDTDADQSQYSRIQSKGIYHGLPVFPDSEKGLSAIVTGANGISGDHMLRVLNESPHRWTNVYALSRRPPLLNRKWNTNVQHIPLDLLDTTPEAVAKVLRNNNVNADYVFYFSYIQAEPKEGAGLWSDAEKMTEFNELLLSNFLEGLRISNITPKRFVLQTGAKNYGIHHGPVITPQHESDSRVLLEPNFYYAQEDLVHEYCKETGAEWNVVRPSNIIGAVQDAAMNLVYPLGVFAAIQSYLGRPLIYPGDDMSFKNPVDLSSAMMNGYMEEWAALTPKAANEAFNASDSSQFTFGKFWKILADWHGVSYQLPDAKTEYKTLEFPFEPPMGFGPKGIFRYTYTLTEWAFDPEVQDAWKKISEKYDLHPNPFSDPKDIIRIFSFTDSAILMSWPLQFNMDKSHELGWHGSVDTIESIKKTLNEFVDLRMLPPLPTLKPKEKS